MLRSCGHEPVLGSCLGVVALTLMVPVVAVAILAFNLHAKTERRINDALTSHYPGQSVTVLSRADWKYANQICFEVAVRAPDTGRVARLVIMIQGDDDGGTWSAGSTYPSQSACKADFNRG